MDFYRSVCNLPCQMTAGEKLALIALLEKLQPNVSIEIGNGQGGSLQILSMYSTKVYAVDFKEVHDALDKDELFGNISFVSGDSKTVLPELLQAIDASGEKLGLVLIDGDHSTEGVMTDLNNVLAYTPIRNLFILCHDSFNPACRRGILKANLQSEYVHFVDVDYLHGIMFKDYSMWGGFALIEMQPKKRTGELEIKQSAKAMFSRLSFFKLRNLLKI